MSPTPNRQLARRDSAANSKPYTRVSSATPTDDSTQGSMLGVVTQGPDGVSIPGFPTYAQYKHIETTYLATLSQRKREKALITQAMFDKIWDTLEDPDRRIDSPQFRFWVRKMFRLSNPNLARPGIPGEENKIILLHDNRPVAIQEQLYELICYCHGRANHGGRDRTRQMVRQHYSWVPKELVAQFLKVCPTCTIRRCGNPDLVAAMKEEQPFIEPPKAERDVRLLPALSESVPESVDGIHFSYFIRPDEPLAQHSWPPGRGPLDCSNDASSSLRCPEPGSLAMKYTFVAESGKSTGEPALTRNSVNLPHPPLTCYSSSSSSASAQSTGVPRKLQSHPMSREVSLYKGLPNGWQFHSDYSEAFEAHMKDKDRAVNTTQVGQRQRPRIPSVAPLRDADFASLVRSNSAIEQATERTLTLPPVLKSLSEGNSEHDSLPPSLQGLLVFPPEPEFEQQEPFAPQIDPVLFGLEMASNFHASSHDQPQYSDIGAAHTMPDSLANVLVSAPTPTKLPSRRPVPPTLDFSTMASLSSINFEDYRSGFSSPFSVSSTTPSTGSWYSQLSPFPVVSPSSLGEPSPSNSAFTSPPEERTKELSDTADGLQFGFPMHRS